MSRYKQAKNNTTLGIDDDNMQLTNFSVCEEHGQQQSLLDLEQTTYKTDGHNYIKKVK